ncbi:MAG: hypothetical protein E4H14_18340, partial [Candidatus Thorarchaeota archaeon]
YNSTNVLLDGSVYGQVIIANCTGLKIQGGAMAQSDMGIALYYSKNCIVNSTTISDGMFGVYLYGSKACNITHSILVNCGIVINGGSLSQWIHNFTGTTVNGKPVGYFFEETGLILDDNSLGQIIVVNSTNITIKNYVISKASQSLAFAYSSKCNIIESNLSDNYIGARLYYCSNVIFENDTILNSINSGVLVYYSNNCTFNNVTVLEATYGIYISGSSNCYINESTLSHNYYGAYLTSSSFFNVSHSVFEKNYEALYIYYLDNSTIYDCQVSYSTNYGLRVFNSNWIVIRECLILDNLDTGIFFYYSHYGTILRNTVSDNKYDGISLYDADYCLIVNNTIDSNLRYGIDAYVFADYNTIYGNNISSNTEGNGYAYTSTNMWDDNVSRGNYWSDYHGPGTYSIEGPGNNVDRYPRGPPVALTSHGDVSFQFESPVASFSWNSYSTEPDYYIIYVDGVIHDQAIWDGLAILADVDTSSLGTFNYTLFVNGTSGYYSIDTVWVTIFDNAPTINSPSDRGYNFDTIGHSIEWELYDVNPFGYYLYIDEKLDSWGDWTGASAQLSIDGLSIGIHNFTMLVNDTSGNSASDTVIVTVWDTEPFLESPYGNVVYEEGTTGNSIYWNATDFNPANYTVFKNSSFDAFNPWNGEPITYSVDGLPIGVYNYTIVIVDTSGQTAANTVFVTVQEGSTITNVTTTTSTTSPNQTTTTTSNGTETPLDAVLVLTISIASIAVILIVVILIFKKRS